MLQFAKTPKRGNSSRIGINSRSGSPEVQRTESPVQGEGVFDPGVIPKEMDIFYRTESEFLPEGKTFESLTPEERKSLKNRYRFDPLRPGMYQAITGITSRDGCDSVY